jgi:hypothetical protein
MMCLTLGTEDAFFRTVENEDTVADVNDVHTTKEHE